MYMHQQKDCMLSYRYRDPKTKELLLNELRTKYKVTIAGPNTLSALLQSYLGFQTLRFNNMQHKSTVI